MRASAVAGVIQRLRTDKNIDRHLPGDLVVYSSSTHQAEVLTSVIFDDGEDYLQLRCKRRALRKNVSPYMEV